MADIDFTPLIKRAVEDQDFGSKLIAFARAHGVELMGGGELSEDELGDVAGGVSFTIPKVTLKYDIKEVQSRDLLSGGHFLPGDQF